MPKYIDIENFSQMVYENFGRDSEYNYRDLIRILKEQPTADVKEVVHGEWIKKADEKLIWFNCSNCDGFVFNNSNYCPNCGADMRGEAE